MLTFLPKPIRGILASILVISNTLFWCMPLYLFAFLRFVGPAAAEPWCTRRVMNIAELWIDCNNLFLGLFTKLEIDIKGGEGLGRDKWYLVFCNHQTWADIVILQRVFNRKIPMQKFFIKQQLIYVPVIGIAWWALDFPIMKRYTREFLKKHPELKGKDLEATRRSCEKFKLTPVSILNFLEGTRYTPAKQASQKSPHKHLLKPKGGGAALVINSLGDKLDCILNVTIHYPEGAPGFFAFLSGNTERVSVIVEQLPVPVEDTNDEIDSGAILRKDFRHWVNGVWEEKDQQLAQLQSLNRKA
ncbi:MAG: acyltransferase [Pseudomonadales bacterium]|nr:acyltransferase [Pseudomonadales bacterium]MDG1443057.1 acyltransferase [Pseudomonadales bacterium]